MKFLLITDTETGFFKLFDINRIEIITLDKDICSNPEEGKIMRINSYIFEIDEFDIRSFVSFIKVKENGDSVFEIKCKFKG